MKRASLILALPLALFCLFQAKADGATLIEANFGGTAEINPWDQYPGQAGGGWLGAWSQKNASSDSSTLSTEVIGAGNTPLNPGYNYLKMTYHRPGVASGASRSGVARSWDTEEVLSLGDYSVGFSVRFDDLTTFNSQGSNSVVFAGTQVDRANQSITQGISLWMVQLYSENKGWGVIKKDDGASSATTFYFGTTNVPVSANTVYTFRIDILASIGKYDVTINGVSASSLNDGKLFNLGSTDVAAFDWLNWQASMISTSESGATLSYALSHVTLQTIPEPGQAGLLLGALVLIGVLRYRRRLSR
ncbi:MAG TPA: hypothetical protein VNQ90_04065 [Chthoniobacteraceae bacterium]|nr:hypothetical protein [Chthoniobacteraceae bacterium]